MPSRRSRCDAQIGSLRPGSGTLDYHAPVLCSSCALAGHQNNAWVLQKPALHSQAEVQAQQGSSLGCLLAARTAVQEHALQGQELLNLQPLNGPPRYLTVNCEPKRMIIFILVGRLN